MKNFITLIFLLISIPNIQAQSDLVIAPNWNVGDKYTVNQKGVVKMKMGEFEIPVEMGTTFDLNVKSKQADGYILDLTNFQLLGLGEEKMFPMLKSIADSMPEFKNLVLEVSISSKGEVKDLLNWKQIQNTMYKVGDVLADSLHMNNMGLTKEDVDSLKMKFREKYFTKEQVLDMNLKNLKHILSGYNVAYPLKGTKEFKSTFYHSIVNLPTDGKDLDTKIRTRLISKNENTTETFYDILHDNEKVFESMKGNKELEMFTMGADPKKFKVLENRKFSFENKTNWPTKVEVNSTLSTDFMETKMNLTYTLTKK